jgi:hypothetical protein
MVKEVILTDKLKEQLHRFLEENSSAELVNTYLYYIQNKFNLQPVLYPKDKIIYQSAEEAMKLIEREHPLWKETEIKITFSKESVNDLTKRIYICPFSGKVFGDNTHPDPQDAIYDWVAKCPENKERVGGLPVKRFFVSEDPEVLNHYLMKTKTKEPIRKTVYSSTLSGKIFGSKEAILGDFKKNYLKPMSLLEVQNQNRFNIEDSFLEFIQKQLSEDKVAAFIEALAEYEEFLPHVQRWLA